MTLPSLWQIQQYASLGEEESWPEKFLHLLASIEPARGSSARRFIVMAAAGGSFASIVAATTLSRKALRLAATCGSFSRSDERGMLSLK